MVKVTNSAYIVSYIAPGKCKTTRHRRRRYTSTG